MPRKNWEKKLTEGQTKPSQSKSSALVSNHPATSLDNSNQVPAVMERPKQAENESQADKSAWSEITKRKEEGVKFISQPIISAAARFTAKEVASRIQNRILLHENFDAVKNGSSIPSHVLKEQGNRAWYFKAAKFGVNVGTKVFKGIPVVGNILEWGVKEGLNGGLSVLEQHLDKVTGLNAEEAKIFEQRIEEWHKTANVSDIFDLTNKLYGCLNNKEFSLEQRYFYVPTLAKLYGLTLTAFNKDVTNLCSVTEELHTVQEGLQSKISVFNEDLEKTRSIVHDHQKRLGEITNLLDQHDKRLTANEELLSFLGQGLNELGNQFKVLGEKHENMAFMCQFLFKQYLNIDISGFEKVTHITNLYKTLDQLRSTGNMAENAHLEKILEARRSLETAIVEENMSRKRFDNKLCRLDQGCQFFAMAAGFAGYPKAQQMLSHFGSAAVGLGTGVGYYFGYGTLVAMTGPFGHMIAIGQILNGSLHLVEAYTVSQNEGPTDPYAVLFQQFNGLAEHVAEFEKNVSENFHRVDKHIFRIFTELNILCREQHEQKLKIEELRLQLEKNYAYHETRLNNLAEEINRVYELGSINTSLGFNKVIEKVLGFLRHYTIKTDNYDTYSNEIATEIAILLKHSYAQSKTINISNISTLSKDLAAQGVIANFVILIKFIEKYFSKELQKLPPILAWSQASLTLSYLTAKFIEQNTVIENDSLAASISFLSEAHEHGQRFLDIFSLMRNRSFVDFMFTEYQKAIIELIQVIQQKVRQIEKKFEKSHLEKIYSFRQKIIDHFEKEAISCEIQPTLLKHWFVKYREIHESEVSLGVAIALIPILVPISILDYMHVIDIDKSAKKAIEKRKKETGTYLEDCTNRIMADYFEQINEDVSCTKMRREYVSSQENTYNKTRLELIQKLRSRKIEDFQLLSGQPSQLTSQNIFSLFLYPYPKSSNQNIINTKLILPCSPALPISCEDKFLELIEERAIVHFYDLDAEESNFIIYTISLPFDSFENFISYNSALSLEDSKILRTDYFIINIPKKVNFNERLWLFWIGGARPDFSENPEGKIVIKRSETIERDDAKGFIIKPKLKTLSGISEQIPSWLMLDLILPASQEQTNIEKSDRLIKKYLTQLRLKINDEITLLVENDNSKLGKALRKLDAYFHLLNCLLSIGFSCDIDSNNILPIRHRKDAIHFFRNIYSGSEIYLHNLLENEYDALISIKSLLKSGNKYGHAQDIEKEISETVSTLKDLVHTLKDIQTRNYQRKTLYVRAEPSKKIRVTSGKLSAELKTTETSSIRKPIQSDHPAQSNHAASHANVTKPKSVDMPLLEWKLILEDKNSPKRYTAIFEIATFIETSNKKEILDLFFKFSEDECFLIRAEIIQQLGCHGNKSDPRVFNILLKGLKDSYQLARLYACESLIKLDQKYGHDHRVINTLFELLRYRYIHWISQRAAQLLVELDFTLDEEIEEILKVGCSFDDLTVKEHALKTLEKLKVKKAERTVDSKTNKSIAPVVNPIKNQGQPATENVVSKSASNVSNPQQSLTQVLMQKGGIPLRKQSTVSASKQPVALKLSSSSSQIQTALTKPLPSVLLSTTQSQIKQSSNIAPQSKTPGNKMPAQQKRFPKTVLFSQKPATNLTNELFKALMEWQRSQMFPRGVSPILEKQSQTQATSFGFDPLDVPGDGNCFFHAVLYQLRNSNKLPSTIKTHKDLRAFVVNHIINHIDSYCDFFDKEKNAFIAEISTPGKWADHVIIQALSRALNVTIAIIRSDESDPSIIKQNNPITTIYLFYIAGRHYQALIPNSEVKATKDIVTHIQQTETDGFELASSQNLAP